MQQQGDVLILEVNEIPKTAKQKKDGILIEGSSTGNKHMVDGKIFVDDKETYICESSKLWHTGPKNDCHATQFLDPKKNYKMRIVKEYDYDEEAARNVAD